MRKVSIIGLILVVPYVLSGARIVYFEMTRAQNNSQINGLDSFLYILPWSGFFGVNHIATFMFFAALNALLFYLIGYVIELIFLAMWRVSRTFFERQQSSIK